jgi:uncharacterized protein (TIGR03083 family)
MTDSEPITESERLADLVEIWWGAVRDAIGTLDSLDRDDWNRPTDLAGWDVRAIAAHLAHLESMLAGRPQQPVEVPATAHVRSPFGAFTESGVLARRDRSATELIAELRTAATSRHDALLADPPTDGSVRPDHLPPGIDWNTETLLANRAVDVWLHDQDVRRAVGRPLDLNSAAAEHALARLATSLGYVVARLAAAPPGTCVVFDLGGHRVGVRVDERGRGLLEAPTGAPDLAIGMSREAYLLAAGGRVSLRAADVEVRGDHELAAHILERMAVTP